MHTRLLITAVLSGIAAPAMAQGKSLDGLLDAALVDMPVTTAPAAFLLGTSGENVPRLSTFRAFSSQIGRAVDDSGKIKNSVAAEIAPVLALRLTTWDDIERSQLQRVLSRTTVSAATKAGGDGGSSKAAVGIQAVLYSKEMDHAIALSSHAKCNQAAAMVDASPPPDGPGSPLRPLPAAALEAIETCQKEIDAVLTKWNQTMVAVGAGRVFTVDDGTGVRTKDPSAFWITASYGFDFSRQPLPAQSRLGALVTGHVRFTRDASVVASSGATGIGDQKLLGVNIRAGNARLAGIAEYSVTRTDGAGGLTFDDRKRSVVGLEYKVDSDLYLTLGVARDSGLPANERSLLAKLNWGFSKTPVLSSAPK